MNETTRDDFVTDGQWNKFCRIKKFFERLIELQNSGHIIMEGGTACGTPFIDGVDIGFKYDNCIILYVGGTWDCDADKVWVDVTIKELKDRIQVYKKVKVW